jgi:hypothetical protein
MKEIRQSQFLSFYNFLVGGEKDKCISIVQSLMEEGVELKDIYIDLF